MSAESVIRYWHAVELLQPQAAPKVKKRNGPYSAFLHDVTRSFPTPPWLPGGLDGQDPVPAGYEWSHTLYACVYDSRLVAGHLKRLFGDDQGYREPQSRESALFASKFTAAGEFVEDSFVLSSEAWFLGRALSGRDWRLGFENDQKAAADQAKTKLQGQVTFEALQNVTSWILQFLGLTEAFVRCEDCAFRFRSQPVRIKQSPSEDDPLNSFLLEDLAAIADSASKGVTSESLKQYLQRHDSRPRLHVDSDEASQALIKQLMPHAYAFGCWPSEKHLGLVHSQQLAVNVVMSSLADGRGLLGINGPPGTGKTTLLRDLIAAIVTQRADVLATLGRASEGFAKGSREVSNDGGKELAVYRLNPSLYGFEIVVASSNNGAVENVTLELPQRDKIDESWLPEAEHFADLGELITGTPAWGLISGALGSKARRKKFVDRYFYGQRPSPAPVLADRNLEDDDNAEPGDGEGLESLVTGTADRGELQRQRGSSQPVKEPEGLLAWLGRHSDTNKERTPEQRRAIWQQAVAEYLAAKESVRRACADASRIRELVESLVTARKRISEQRDILQSLTRDLTETSAAQQHLDADEGARVNLTFKNALADLRLHQGNSPGFWANVRSFWGAARAWKASLKQHQAELDHAQAEFERVARLVGQLEATRRELDQRLIKSRQAIDSLTEQEGDLKRQASALAEASRADHLLEWLRTGAIGRGEAVELAEPWRIEGWRQARARVFVQALKLHRTFLELEASRVRSNLFYVNSLLTGSGLQGLSRDAIRSAWASLFMVVPVLSSTFASFARSFRSLGPEEIGWVLVDEAGQAPPQAAVGALWRSRRALLVGDPLQLKPIVTVSDAVLEHMRTRYKVEPHWLPNRHSAQELADAATSWGRLAGPVGKKVWVGLPLVVHRRCDKPMFNLANRIAYDGAMVYGTVRPHPEKETRARLPTGWIQVSGRSEENWVPAEGEALRALLVALGEDGVDRKDISIITPFRAVKQGLSRTPNSSLHCGTVHTMQGKEAPIVIMVLGGNTSGSGARDWVVSEPNLLNVAATRAKRRLYVIGDRSDWQNRALFRDVLDLLPVQRIPGYPIASTSCG